MFGLLQLFMLVCKLLLQVFKCEKEVLIFIMDVALADLLDAGIVE